MEIKYLNEECDKISKSCDLEFGKELTTLTASNNLLINNPHLNQSGYGLFSLRSKETFFALESLIKQHIIQQLSQHQEVPADFTLGQYHRFLASEDVHYKISTWALDYKILGDTFYEIIGQVEEMLGLKLKLKKIKHLGIEGEYVGFRVLRPQKNDHNPFHRDAWIPYWRDTVNIWLPICGFENGNSLQLIPESHLWMDDEILKTKAGVEIDGKKYHVSAAIGTVNEFSTETPVLKRGDALIFSPYLIHGNGVNRENDLTRVSVEFRFCKQ
jgi:hypothetical protein